MKDVKRKMTNLQDDTASVSEDAAKTDKVSAEGVCVENNDSEKTKNENDSCEKEITKESGMDNEKNEEKEAELPVSETADTSWEEKYTALNDSHLRLMAEYDNFRKRTVREKADLIKSGGANVLTSLLPVIDDFERALGSLQTTDDVPSVIEGVKLIYDKFIAYLAQQGVTVIDAIGQSFDTELFEAIATLPATDEDKKGRVIDCVQTGYKLYDKVLRHAKVVVGE